MREKCKEKREKKRRGVDILNTTEQEIFEPEEVKQKKIIITRSFTRNFTNYPERDFFGPTINRSFTSVRGSL